jgi:methionyl-tRNA formyltransferase
MIHLLGHNQIVVNLSNTLFEREIPFKVYSKIETEIAGNNFIKVDNTTELKKLLKSDINKRLIISAGAPWILDQDFLNSFEPEGVLNIHGTALPIDRGGTVVSWFILNKKRLGNAIIHKMSALPDAGPIVSFLEFIYPINCQLPEDYLLVYNKYQEKLVTTLCLQWNEGQIDISKASDQPHYLSTYWPRLKADQNAWINWNWSGEEIELFIRAFDDPYTGAISTWRGKKIFLKKCFFQKDNHFHPYQFGLIFRVRKTLEVNYLAISVSGGSLYVEECNDEAGNSMLDKIKEGDRIQTSDEQLFISQKRTIKTKTGFGFQKDSI